jgi:hypothetical protein
VQPLNPSPGSGVTLVKLITNADRLLLLNRSVASGWDKATGTAMLCLIARDRE